MKCGIASLSHFPGIKMIEYLTSTFIIPGSIFDIQSSIVNSGLSGLGSIKFFPQFP